MRPWRKLHSSILESERLMDVSSDAKVLFFLLVTAQDDTGYYPWERMKVRHLVTVCGWTEQQAKIYADALVARGLATWEGQGIVLRKGSELNGQPRDDRKGVVYQRSTTDTHPITGDIPVTVSDSQLPVSDVLEEEEDKRKRRGREESSAKAPVVEIPEWVNKSLWESFLEMRKKVKATPTLYAQGLLIKTLTELKAQGNSPDAVLEQSIMNGWKGLFVIKNGGNNGKYGRGVSQDSGKDKVIYRIPKGQPILGSKPTTML